MNKAYEYAKKAISGKLKDCYGKKTIAPKYVIKQCENFIKIFFCSFKSVFTVLKS